MNDPHQFLPLKPAVHLILLTLAETPQHGYGLMQAVRDRSEGRIDLGTGHLYRHLKKLLDAGLIAEEGDASGAGEDARRRHYHLTDFGRDVLATEAKRLLDLVERTRALGLDTRID